MVIRAGSEEGPLGLEMGHPGCCPALSLFLLGLWVCGLC